MDFNSAMSSVEPLLLLQILCTFLIASLVVCNSSLLILRGVDFLAGTSQTLAAYASK